MFPRLKSKLDYDDLAHAPEDGKQYELLDGELFVTPAPNPYHQRASKRLQRQLERYFEDRGLGEVFDAPLDVILTPRDVVEPDVMVVTDARQISRRGIEGPPAIVVEILSPSTANRDRTVKAKRYEATGVPHYWVLDLEAQRLDCYRLTDQQYVLVVTATPDQLFHHPDWPDLRIDVVSLWT
jgi:Uma2 family endonuclease